jgi:HSP20 family protein
MAEANAQKTNQTQPAEQQAGQQPQTNQMQTAGQTQTGRGLASRDSFLPTLFSVNPHDLFNVSPFELMRRFAEDMGHAFESFGLTRSTDFGGNANWSPTVEVFERDNNLVVHADLPGMNKEDVKIELMDGGVVIKGERKQEHEERGEGFYRSERSYGQFYRLIPLPEGANPDQAKAQFENGVLEITVPIPESRRRNLPIGEPSQTGETQAAQAAGGQTKRATGGSQ